jgi:DeoR/GlpR family transcriptional regulator of sugar metabolism
LLLETCQSSHYKTHKPAKLSNMESTVSTMLKKERHGYILKQINLHNKVLSSQQSIELQVSEDTIRRDLAELADSGEILKVHGGALSKSYHYSNQQKTVYAQDAKIEIAKKAVKLIKENMVVLTEAGTTMMEMVKLIPDDLQATFFTVSPLIALELAEHPLLTVILLGGQMDMSSQICIGEKPVSELSDIRVDLCFLGANAIDSKKGLTELDWKVVQVKKAMISASSKLAILTISEKLNSIQKMQLCKPPAIDFLITELKPADKRLVGYRKHMNVL